MFTTGRVFFTTGREGEITREGVITREHPMARVASYSGNDAPNRRVIKKKRAQALGPRPRARVLGPPFSGIYHIIVKDSVLHYIIITYDRTLYYILPILYNTIRNI